VGSTAGRCAPRAVPLDGRGVGRRRGDAFGVARRRLGPRAPSPSIRNSIARSGMGRNGGPPLPPDARDPPGPALRVGAGSGAHRRRLAAPHGPRARQRAHRSDGCAARGDPGARAGPRPPARLPRQPGPVGGGDAAVLPPGRLVGLGAHPARTGRLLRRHRQPRLRRRDALRPRAGGDGRTARPRCRALRRSSSWINPLSSVLFRRSRRRPPHRNRRARARRGRAPDA